MKKLRKLGQHFLTSKKIAKDIVTAANLTKQDSVLEIGTGKGILIPFLCKSAKKVVSFETDKKLYHEATLNLKTSNLKLKFGDGFKSKENFTVFVSNLPYSKSRNAIEWLIQKRFSRAVIMVQKEFAEKLQAKSTKKRKAISILAQYALDIEPIIQVNKTNFIPPPKVNSVVLKLTSKNIVSKELIKTVNKLFSYRRKTLKNIVKQFGKEIDSTKRLDDLDGDEIIKIAKQISK
ncbi:MAG TPA: rRNA adenine dimethyltransferase family protein [Nitrosopumilaceae archaeon]|nr:rRNA adenine dimethyltransferase family protein [Nitrosopumilaceae archaeon]